MLRSRLLKIPAKLAMDLEVFRLLAECGLEHFRRGVPFQGIGETLGQPEERRNWKRFNVLDP